MHRVLGVYVVSVAVLQTVLYTAAVWYGERAVWLFYFDPRMGLSALETVFRSQDVFPGALSWISAAILAAIGIALIGNPAWVRTYLWVETIMALPSVLLIVAVFLGNMSPAHGLSAGELVVPLPVFLVTSAVPLTLAWRLRRTLGPKPR